MRGFIVAALLTLAVIYAYNYLSKDGIAALGRKTA